MYQQEFLEAYKHNLLQFLKKYRSDPNPDEPHRVFYHKYFDYCRMEEMIAQNRQWEEGYTAIKRCREEWGEFHKVIQKLDAQALKIMHIHWKRLLSEVRLPLVPPHDITIYKRTSWAFSSTHIASGKIWEVGQIIVERNDYSNVHHYTLFTKEGLLILKRQHEGPIKDYQQRIFELAQNVSRNLLLQKSHTFVLQKKMYDTWMNLLQKACV